MKIIIAPDSFKDSLSAQKVAQHIHLGVKEVNSSIESIQLPMADGGEGSIDILTEVLGGTKVKVNVLDPLLRPTTAIFGWVEATSTAIIEMAQASGIQLLTPPERNPLLTSSYGTGQLIAEALKLQCKKILMCIGGSATNDVGCGMLQALGVKFIDHRGKVLPTITGQLLKDIDNIDASHLQKLTQDISIEVLSDVDNLLYGFNGATNVYATQKGATSKDKLLLEKAIIKYSEVIFNNTGVNPQSIKGGGAAGGIGAALHCFLKGYMMSGVQSIMNAYRLEELFQQVDSHSTLVITGEGKLDTQSKNGKVVSGVAQLAKKYNLPVIALAGKVENTPEENKKLGVDAAFSIMNAPMKLEQAMQNTSKLIEFTTSNIINLWLMGLNNKV